MKQYEKEYLNGFCEELENNGWKKVEVVEIGKILDQDEIVKRIKLINSFEFEMKDKIITEVMSKLNTNNEKRLLQYLKYGVEVFISWKNTQVPIHIKLIDYEVFDNNSFYYFRERIYRKGNESMKADIILQVNGIPLVIIEGKNPLKRSEESQYFEALRDIRVYQYKISELFKYVQIGVGVGEKNYYMGTSPSQDLESIKNETQWRNVDKKEDIHELLSPKNLVNFLQNHIFFTSNNEGNQVKLLGRYNQVRATKKAIARISLYQESKDEKNRGLIWHWQGSGKSYTMFFIGNQFLQKYHRKNPVVFFLVDRLDLQTQLIKVINSIDNPLFREVKKIDNIRDLQRTIENIKKGNEWGLKIVTIQKFRPDGLNYREIIEKENVLFLIDEAQRTQYGEFASTMKYIFKNAMFFGFTGTPVFKSNKNTFNEFSYPDAVPQENFLDVYFMSDSERDKYTLPITHITLEEGKNEDGIKIKLTENEIKAVISAFDNDYEKTKAGLENEDLFKVKKKFKNSITKTRVFLSNEVRIKKLAKKISNQIKEDTESYNFGAMIVATNRKSCVLFKKYLNEEFSDEFSEIVMSYDPKEKEQELGDYKSKLRKKYGLQETTKINEIIKEKFLKNDKLKVLIVTNMLLTGFDAPKLKVMYLDKPLYCHNLLQAIARVNRPSDQKNKSLIVDSIGLLTHTKKSISLYNQIANKDKRMADELRSLSRNSKEELEELKKKLKNVEIKLKYYGINLNSLNFSNVNLIKNQIEKLSVFNEEDKEVNKLFKEIKDVLKDYISLGSEPKKLDIKNYIDNLSSIYFTFIRLTQPKRKENKLNFLIQWIKEKVLVEDFYKKFIVQLNPNFKEDGSLNERFEVDKETVGELYFKIKNDLKENKSNPLYKSIILKLEKIRTNWVRRNVGLEEFLPELKKLNEEKDKLDKISEKPFQERVGDFTSKYFKEELNLRIDLIEFQKFLKSFKDYTNIFDKETKQIKLEIAKIIIKGIPRKERLEIGFEKIREIEKVLTDYIIDEILREVKNGEEKKIKL